MINPDSKKELQEMVARYQQGTASAEEIQFVEAYFQYVQKDNNGFTVREDATLEESLLQRIHHAIAEQELPLVVPIHRKTTWLRAAAAAAVILALGAGAYLFARKTPPGKLAGNRQNAVIHHDVAPGGNRAMLTLADGRVITLDSAAKGTLARQGNTRILMMDTSQLAYAQPAAGAVAHYNTLTTPRGGQFQVVLADGSKVWLNAASSLRYPTAFTGKERKVELSGEGYFEIAAKADMPFSVQVNDMKVTVLGTHFNIMAYGEEATIQTTLLEGGVSVASGNFSSHLKPGQQAVLNKQGQLKTLAPAEVDVENTVAWKNGMFSFQDADIATVMRQLARWYNVSVTYKGSIPNQRFGGYVSRNSNLSQVLKILALSGVKFSIEEKKIIVLP